MAYNSKKNEVSNVIFNTVKSVLNQANKTYNQKTCWTGTMSDLDLFLRDNLKNNLPENWPGSPSALRIKLNSVVNRLRNAGMSIRFVRANNRTRTRLVRFSNNNL